MTPTNEAPPSRAMDAAVARAMGYEIMMVSVRPVTFALWDGKNDNPLIEDTDRGYGLIWLPRYSRPNSAYHRAALIEALLWLNGHGVAVIQEDGAWHAGAPTGAWIVSVPTTHVHLATYALCVCRAVLTVAGVREVTE